MLPKIEHDEGCVFFMCDIEKAHVQALFWGISGFIQLSTIQKERTNWSRPVSSVAKARMEMMLAHYGEQFRQAWLRYYSFLSCNRHS